LNQADYFELFDLPRGFEVNTEDLEQRWKTRVAAVHPDRFAGASDAEKRVAMQWSASVNEAYRVLRDPLKRAQYLCDLAGFQTENLPGASMDMAFLVQQMQWREELERIRDSQDAKALTVLANQIEADRENLQSNTATLIGAQQWDEVVKRLQEWMFVEKLLQEIKSVERAFHTTQ
jgi:molecular chaperone HscB